MHRVIYTCERVQVPSQLNSAKFNCCTENLMQSYRSGCFPRDIYIYIYTYARKTFILRRLFSQFAYSQTFESLLFSRDQLQSRYQPLTSRVAVSSREVIRSKNRSLHLFQSTSRKFEIGANI